MRKSGSWLCFIGLFLLVAALLMTLVEWSALDGRYHMKLLTQQRAAGATGLTPEGVTRASKAFIDYLNGEDVDLAYTDSVYGIEQTVFGPDEVSHMEDVLGLFNAGRAIRLWSVTLGLAFALAGWLRTRRVRALFRALLFAAILWTALIAAFALWAAFDFDNAFILFHQVLFTNELWMMDSSQLMIRMLPAEFFMALAGHIAYTMAGGLVALIAVSVLFLRRKKRT